MNYTKGEWNVSNVNGSGLLHIETKGTHIYIGCMLDNEQGKANANLIASAPKMAHLLEHLVNKGCNVDVIEEAENILVEIREGK